MNRGPLKNGKADAAADDVPGPDYGNFRLSVAESSVRLYSVQGFEATSVEDIARAAGISRSTFFRQFRSKEDVVFADHDELIEQAKTILVVPEADPWRAVCEAAAMVFRHYSRQGESARQRYQVVNAVPALRDRELVTVFRYEQLFNEHLRQSLPGLAPLKGIQFTSAVVSTNNYFLRSLIRDDNPPTEEQLWTALDEVCRLHGVRQDGRRTEDDDTVVVAVFPRTMPAAEMVRRFQSVLKKGSDH
jgi:AcrR family transcriptional regulator